MSNYRQELKGQLMELNIAYCSYLLCYSIQLLLFLRRGKKVDIGQYASILVNSLYVLEQNAVYRKIQLTSKHVPHPLSCFMEKL